MNGHRLATPIEGSIPDLPTPGVLAYWKDFRGVFMLYHPAVGLGDLKNHDVTEHDDGTITVSPSILITGSESGKKISVHGFLERGIWRDA